MLAPERYLEVIAEQSDLFSTAAADGDPDRRVPSCPDWSMRELVVHLGSVFAGVEEVVRTRASAPGDAYDEEPLNEDETIEWFDVKAAALLTTLSDADPATRVWTWWRDRTVSFWLRRMAHEVTVHRWDAENASGIAPNPIAEDVATDGIDELLSVHLFDGDPAAWPEGGTLGVRLAGSGRAWRVSMGPKLIEMTRTDGPAEATLAGPPEDALLVLWGRKPLDPALVSGDATLVQRWLDW
jgi:uncharacterized protein (TIGR03083 family)